MSERDNMFDIVYDMAHGRPTYADLIVPNPGSHTDTAEIDALLLTAKGIFVFEFIDSEGWIFGGSGDRYWTASLGPDQKERLGNPVMQNRAHIKELASFLDLQRSVFKSYLVFSKRCILKKVPDATDEFRICQRPALRSLLRRDLEDRMAVFSPERLAEVRRRLDLLAEMSAIEGGAEQEEQVGELMRTCPHCGKPLVERRRASDGGIFIGCSGYPACRYTRSSW